MFFRRGRGDPDRRVHFQKAAVDEKMTDALNEFGSHLQGLRLARQMKDIILKKVVHID